MQMSLVKKLLTGFLAILLLAGTLAVIPVSAASTTQSATVGSDSATDTNGTGTSDKTTDITFYDKLASGDAGILEVDSGIGSNRVYFSPN